MKSFSKELNTTEHFNEIIKRKGAPRFHFIDHIFLDRSLPRKTFWPKKCLLQVCVTISQELQHSSIKNTIFITGTLRF